MGNGLIFDIRRFSVHDGPGIRTTVFFKGCPLSCWWCHNPESRDPQAETSVKQLSLGGKKISREETTGKWSSVDDVMQEIERDHIFYDESEGGVTFSGGEPLMQEAFLVELLKACRQSGIHTTLDTSGYSTAEAMAHVAGLTDLILFDLKIMNEQLHLQYTGVSNGQILENLKFLIKKDKKLILRFPVIPGITDTAENISEMKSFIAKELISHPSFQQINPSANQHIITSSHQHISTSAHQLQLSLLPFHSLARDKYRRFCKTNKLMSLPDVKAEDLIPLKREYEEIGLRVTIGS